MSIIDEHEEIRRRMEEIRAKAQEALTGSSAPVQEPVQDVESIYGYAGLYNGPPYTNYTVGYGAASTSGTHTTRVKIDPSQMQSLAHPNWPYKGTGFEWRRFVRS